MKTIARTLALLGFAFTPVGWAQDSGFLDDYSRLSDQDESGRVRVYIAPGATEALARFNKVMIDQPSIVISVDSKYRGIKPQHVLEVSEALRASLIEGIGLQFPVVDQPGEDVAYLNWAVSNVRVNKAKRGLLGYTPVGAVAYGAKKAMSDIVDKTRAFDVVFEFEASDSVTGEALFAMVVDLGKAEEEVAWDQALDLTQAMGKRLACRINNARLPESEQADCLAITLHSPE